MWVGEESLLELADGVLGQHQFYGDLHLVIGEDDGAAGGVDVGDVGGVDDEAAADAFEVEAGDGVGCLDKVLEACQKEQGAAALELEGDVVAVACGVHDVVEAHLDEFVTCAEVDAVLFVILFHR